MLEYDDHNLRSKTETLDDNHGEAFHRSDAEGHSGKERSFTGDFFHDLRHLDDEAKTNVDEDSGSGEIKATPYRWVEPSDLPQRSWLYGRHLIRKTVSVTVGLGGVGKSRLLMTEALAMASGKKLLHDTVLEPLKVWIWNLEDDKVELSRCAQAASILHNISEEEIEGRLFLDSGRDRALCTATMSRGAVEILEPVYQAVTFEIISKGIDVLIIDPFVSSHRVPENDNGVIDAVVKRWAKVADDANCAIELVHHSRKEAGNDITANSTRGGGAIVAAARDVRVINQMSKQEGTQMGVESHRQYFRVGSDKANFALIQAQQWYHIESVDLCNGDYLSLGDSVGVVKPFTIPDPMESITPEMQKEALARISQGDCRYNPQATDWAGNLLADILNVEVESKSKAGISKLKGVLAGWEHERLIRKVSGIDKNSRKEVPFYEVC